METNYIKHDVSRLGQLIQLTEQMRLTEDDSVLLDFITQIVDGDTLKHNSLSELLADCLFAYFFKHLNHNQIVPKTVNMSTIIFMQQIR